MTTVKTQMNRVKSDLNRLKQTLYEQGLLTSHNELRFSGHLCERIVERHLERDIPFIQAIVKYFVVEVFHKHTYNDRRYCIQLKGLKV